MRNRPLMILGVVFLLTAIYLFFDVSLHGVTSWQLGLIISIALILVDLEFKKLQQRLDALEADNTAA